MMNTIMMTNVVLRGLVTLLLATAMLGTASAQETVEYIHTDALGSPVAISDASGHTIKRTVYEPYGAVMGGEVDGEPGYTGHVSDSATGLIYMQQRYYDSEVGKFISIDPVGTSPRTGENFSRYWYASSNPYKNKDPDGRCDGPSTCAIDRDIDSLNSGELTRDEFSERSQARGAGAVAGVALVGVGMVAVEAAAALGAGGGLRSAVAVADRANKINHIFGKEVHNLKGVLKSFGSKEKAFRAMERAANKAVDLSKDGRFETTVKLGGEQVTLRGAVVDGKARLGTAFVKPPPPPTPPLIK